MQLKEFSINLDIMKIASQSPYFEVVSGDYEANIISISLANGIAPYPLDGLDVEIVFAKPDGTIVVQDASTGVTVNESVITCVLASNTIAAAGRVISEVRVMQGEKVLTSARFSFYVRTPIINDDAVKSTNEYPMLIQALEDAKEATQGAQDIADTVQQKLNNGEFIGPQGEQGDPGDAATVAVGTVTTLDAGESATVANSGTSGAAVLDFGLPQGAKGDKGDPGLDGSAVPIDDASTATDRVLSASYIKGQLSAIDAEVDSLKLWIEMDMRVFGVEFDTATTSPTLTRINDSVGKVANAGVDAQVVTNDFDALPIFGEMHEVTDSLGNVFIRIPKFYIYKSKGAKTVKKVSKYKWPGFYLPWCFWDFANNRELPYFDFGKYKAGNDGSNRLTSKAEEYPLTGQNIVTFRTRAQANGAGYQQLDVHAYDVLTTLMQIEFATLDMQSVMQGYTTGQYSASHTLTADTNPAGNTIVVANATGALYRVGQAISVGTTLGGNQRFYGRTITQIDVDTPGAGSTTITFDGDTVALTTGDVLYNTGYKNGFSAGITASSGSVVANDGKYPCSYRGIESPYGDVWQCVDGVNINDWQAWVCDNAGDYASNVFANPYKQLSYINADANNWITEMGLDANNPAADFPSAVGAIGSSPYKDYYYQASGSRIAPVGGSWRDGSGAGPACWALSSSATLAIVDVGGRLLYKPI